MKKFLDGLLMGLLLPLTILGFILKALVTAFDIGIDLFDKIHK